MNSENSRQPIADGTPQVDRPLTLLPTCMNLRHKLMYCDERHMQIGMVDASSQTRVFFCTKTGESLGPDERPVHPHDCGSGRGCHQSPPMARNLGGSPSTQA